MQDKYINQIFDLFQDFHILLVPQLTEEVRGVDSINSFSHLLVEEYNPEEHGEMLEVEYHFSSKSQAHTQYMSTELYVRGWYKCNSMHEIRSKSLRHLSQLA